MTFRAFLEHPAWWVVTAIIVSASIGFCHGQLSAEIECAVAQLKVEP